MHHSCSPTVVGVIFDNVFKLYEVLILDDEVQNATMKQICWAVEGNLVVVHYN